MYIENNLDNQPLFVGTHKRLYVGSSERITTEDSEVLVTEGGEYLVTEGPTVAGVAPLCDPGADFKSCGAQIGAVVYNDTDGSYGLITAVTEDTVTVTLAGGTHNAWNYGDAYSIYITATKGSLISYSYTDKRYGHRAASKNDLTKGLFFKDIDLDEYGKDVFGPRQPKKEYV